MFYKVMRKIWEVTEGILVNSTKAYLNTVVGQGMLKKLIGYTVDKFFDELIDPIMQVALVKMGYKYDVKDGQRMIEKLNVAKEEGNAQDYNSTVDDILN